MNWLKDRLEAQDEVLGVWLATGSHVAAEQAAAAGFDWALIDMEHGLGDEDAMLRMIQVLSRTGTAPVVRVPAGAGWLLQKALDFGAGAIMVPMIGTAEQAAAFVRTLRYPPLGARGMTSSSRAADYGSGFRDYFAKANDRMLGIVQIETPQAVEHVDAIAALDGADVLFVGHSDLSLSLGCYGQLEADVVLEAEARILEACARHGKRAGMLLKSGAPVEPYRTKGFSFIALGSDTGCLRQGYAQLLAAAGRKG